jgi:hypothetical protein
MTDREDAAGLLLFLGSHVNPPPHVVASIKAVEFTWREGGQPVARVEYNDGSVKFMDQFKVVAR